MRILLLLAWISAGASLGAAQVHFRADLGGDQEVPPVKTQAFGWAEFTLNANNTVTYRVETSGLNATDAHIHFGGPGQNGGVLEGLQGGPGVWSGTTASLSAASVALLQSEGLYVNVHTALHPGGEIRGQIEPRPVHFGARLTGDQEVPPVSTAAVGEASFVANSDRTITYVLTTTNLTGGTVAHIHAAPYGQNGAVVFPLSGGPTVWSGTTPAMTPAQLTALQTGGYYVNAHSARFPAGEIRGQIVPSGVPYGAGSPRPGGPAVLVATGAPVAGGTVRLELTGGLPDGAGFLVVSLLPDADSVLGHPVLVQTAAIFAVLPIALDPTGRGGLEVPWPGSTVALDVYLQLMVLDGAAPGGFYTSNGLKLPITNF